MGGGETAAAPAAYRSDLARRAALIADRFQHGTGGALTSDAERARWLRLMLEEMGAHCEDSPQLTDLSGFLITSPRGLEAITSSRLDDSERVRLYAHFFAHVLVGDTQGPIAVCLEYADARGDRDRSVREKKQEGMAEAVARAMLGGRLERTPRYIYYSERPGAAAGPPWAGLRRRVGALLHRVSLALFRRSRRYQRVRCWGVTTEVLNRVQNVLAA